jgi:ribosomal protein S17E
MTAEIAIMNKEAIALASDSAVTIRAEPEQKIFTSANKLFTLSKYHPVGIMLYGNATLMGIPWETIIKIYRKNLGKTKFEKLEEYADNFIDFLNDENSLFPVSIQDQYFHQGINAYFRFIREAIEKELASRVYEAGKISEKEIKHAVSAIIGKHYEQWQKTDNVPSIPENFNKKLMVKYKDVISKEIKNIFERLPLSKTDSEKLRKIASNLFSKFPEGIEKQDLSGVVIAGFGEKEIFPSIESFLIEAKVNNRLKYMKAVSSKIDFVTNASIVPFAQREMVDVFMEGADPSYLISEKSYLSQLFKDYAEILIDNIGEYNDKEKNKLKKKMADIGNRILQDHDEKLAKHRRENYVMPVVSVVSILPKDELAAMAEALVNLTSFKRKVSMQSETVGGPIDVAVISKGDGFVWIKRKHYFKAELNSQFFANYFQGDMS